MWPTHRRVKTEGRYCYKLGEKGGVLNQVQRCKYQSQLNCEMDLDLGGDREGETEGQNQLFSLDTYVDNVAKY